MGPTIILDKSAYQSLSEADTYELDRYFSVVVPPVLIIEILADLKKARSDPDVARRTVRTLARKIYPIGRVNTGYRTLCIASLLGGDIPMTRQALVGGGRRVVAKDGSVGIFTDVQPEKEALLRWSRGQFDAAEEILASDWRAAISDFDLAAYQRHFHANVPRDFKPSLQRVCDIADQVLALPEAQQNLIDRVLHEVRTIPEVRRWTINRWRTSKADRLLDFALYAYHCARMNLVFYQAVIHHLIGTRSSNRIDMEYLYYLPFANIFSSRDKLHIMLASQLNCPDQSFVSGDDLRTALREVAKARAQARALGGEAFKQLQPEPGSLIRRLWIKHVGRWPNYPPGAPVRRSKEEVEQIVKKVQPWIEAMEEARKAAPQQPRWPGP